jgi:type II secretory pathway pseudopilin PulG
MNDRARSEAGFTLVETLIAIVILVFGIVAVANLFVVAAASNSMGNQLNATTTQAVEIMERLKSVPFTTITGGPVGLSEGGSLTSDLPSKNTSNSNGVTCPGSATVVCDYEAPCNIFVGGNLVYNCYRYVRGVGMVRTRWTIERPGAGGTDTYFIEVRSEVLGTLGGSRTRAHFSTFRTCTVDGCPF